jgi:hypothetical protein
MTTEELRAALTSVDTLGRDIVDRVIVGFKGESSDSMLLKMTPLAHQLYQLSGALDQPIPAVQDRLKVLVDTGVLQLDAQTDIFVYSAGNVCDFFALREEMQYL